MDWWEKTVEYYFIRKFISDEMILSPLDGEHERAGDALLSNHEKWIVIEFKKDSNSLASERRKYKNYSEAKKELSSSDDHHFLIYGQVDDGNFSLVGKTYFSNKNVSDVGEILYAGKGKESFIFYLERLVKHKSKVEESSGGSIGSYSFVAAVSNENKITRCMNLYEFGLDHGLNLEPSPEMKRVVENEYSGPSMGM
ncbi:hypothetical protein [Kushneria marisflavi]|uniref:Uncharacterized protein n=1 Tax=Kushneria marisflavi TaxID=157779 RepID=A0A240UMY7_9GAMM|nr:hypothetical protein [Kushneria marisflavi]ART62851.1 hypothetical protein B9H00_07135 [Kushneria marisflavi]RKD84936.1 hypothetical protein C8D96_2168 [Kushneria marisflavi]